jgi:ATP-dependent helicase HrpB
VSALPVDEILPGIVDALQSRRNLVLIAPAGAGKTTRVPPALLRVDDRGVLVLEPRRLAVRMAARRVAQELGEPLGETVGYQVRFEEVSGPRTRLRFVTEGVLTRRFLSDPMLAETGVVVLDEFHERHLETDLALALVRRLQQTSRPDLRIVVMSATLDPDPVARFLGNCPVLRSEGRLHPVAIKHRPYSAAPLEEQVASAVERLDGMERAGHILVFLPGAAEIRRAARACEKIARRAGLVITPLHGDLAPAEQDRAVYPSEHHKLILSTNVAESSITIEGVAAVIDSGLARVPVDSPWTGVPSLNVTRISKASAAQRAGRAGRTGPGRAVRLYTAEDYGRRPDHDTPEITRRELSQLALDLAAMGVHDLEWLDPPPPQSLEAARALLVRLGAVTPSGSLTDAGRRMVALPLHPRLARLVVEAERHGIADDGCAAAAVLSAGERLESAPPHPSPSDLLALIDREWQPATRRAYEQIRRTLSPRGRSHHNETALLVTALIAFPDRIAARRQGREYLTAGGAAALLCESSSVNAPFIVALDAETRRERGLLIRLASAIEPEWLIDLFPDRITERDSVEWNRTAERVERVSALLYDGLVIEESRGAPPDPQLAATLLAEKALEIDIGRFVDAAELRTFLARVEFASERSGIRRVTEDDVRSALRAACAGKRSFAELEREDLIKILKARAPDLSKLDDVAPAELRLPNGRRVKVHYESGQPPWIASRLQDFFGMEETPRIAGTPVVVRLLAPNHRPVQTTSDLAGFWRRLYPQLRRELSRRYPKHAWPGKPV